MPANLPTEETLGTCIPLKGYGPTSLCVAWGVGTMQILHEDPRIAFSSGFNLIVILGLKSDSATWLRAVVPDLSKPFGHIPAVGTCCPVHRKLLGVTCHIVCSFFVKLDAIHQHGHTYSDAKVAPFGFMNISFLSWRSSPRIQARLTHVGRLLKAECMSQPLAY